MSTSHFDEPLCAACRDSGEVEHMPYEFPGVMSPCPDCEERESEKMTDNSKKIWTREEYGPHFSAKLQLAEAGGVPDENGMTRVAFRCDVDDVRKFGPFLYQWMNASITPLTGFGDGRTLPQSPPPSQQVEWTKKKHVHCGTPKWVASLGSYALIVTMAPDYFWVWSIQHPDHGEGARGSIHALEPDGSYADQNLPSVAQRRCEIVARALLAESNRAPE